MKMMGLNKNPNLTSLKDSYISFDFMYDRFGHSKSYPFTWTSSTPKRMHFIPNMYAHPEDASGWVDLLENLREEQVPKVEKMSHYKADFKDDDIPHRCQAQNMWHSKLILERESMEPDKYQAGHAPLYLRWIEDDHIGLIKTGFGHGHMVIDEEATTKVKYNQMRKWMRECESEYQEILEAQEKIITEWKDMALRENNRLVYLEQGLVELEGKFLKKINDCLEAEGNEGGHLARAYLLLGLLELIKLYKGGKMPNLGKVLLGPSS